MTERGPNPVQLSLFEQRTVPVSWVAKRWNVSKDTVLRLLQSGSLRGYRITFAGWWRVFEASVFEYEKQLRSGFQDSEGAKGAKGA